MFERDGDNGEIPPEQLLNFGNINAIQVGYIYIYIYIIIYNIIVACYRNTIIIFW